MFIRSERLFLRPAWLEDAPELALAIGEEAIVRNLARVPWPYRDEHARQWLERPDRPGMPTFLVTLPGEGARIAGTCGLHEDDGEVAIGYWIARRYWNCGFATEAARAVLNVARTLGHRRVAAHHFVDNPASGRVLLKAGFRPVGRARDRFSAGRGHAAPALPYVAELDHCDDGRAMKCAA